MGKEKKPERMLTEVELELMSALWDLGEATIKEVQAKLPANRQLAYTSVATMMKILEGKKVVGSRKGERVYSYYPLVKRTDYEARALRHVADRLFQGSPSSMVMRLLDDAELSTDELAAIRRLLDERSKA